MQIKQLTEQELEGIVAGRISSCHRAENPRIGHVDIVRRTEEQPLLSIFDGAIFLTPAFSDTIRNL